jgi:hypothetical protein
VGSQAWNLVIIVPFTSSWSRPAKPVNVALGTLVEVTLHDAQR